MEKWEYHSMHLNACIRNPGVREFVAQRWPDWDPPQYSPELIMPQLNETGAEGWELVSIQPVVSWDYFAVFKRRIE